MKLVFRGVENRITIISTRATVTMGTWNARTTFQNGKTAQAAAENRNSLAVLGIRETRRTGFGQRRPYHGGTAAVFR